MKSTTVSLIVTNNVKTDGLMVADWWMDTIDNNKFIVEHEAHRNLKWYNN